MKTITTCLTLFGLAGLAGCSTSTLIDEVEQHKMTTRNCILAHAAWCEMKHCYEGIECIHDFGKGFRAGYKNVASGGNGCQPVLPPRWYWGIHYQTPAGQCCVMAWFDGFTHGAVAAQQDGVGGLGSIPISPTARENFNAMNTPIVDDHSWGTPAHTTPPPSPAPPSEEGDDDYDPIDDLLPPGRLNSPPVRQPYEPEMEAPAVVPPPEDANNTADAGSEGEAFVAPREVPMPIPFELPVTVDPASSQSEGEALPVLVNPFSEEL